MLLLPGLDPALQLLLQLMGTHGQSQEAAPRYSLLPLSAPLLLGHCSMCLPRTAAPSPSRSEPTLESIFCSFARCFSSFSRLPPRLAKRLGSVVFL